MSMEVFGDGIPSGAPMPTTLPAAPEVTFEGPFGTRRMIYADFTASGRSLPAVERAIERVVLPFYGNTHSEASDTGRRTTRLREAARRAVRRSVGATDRHAVIFCGSGATGAVNKLVAMLGLTMPANQRMREILLGSIPESERPVVLVGPYEHHSNELPWRESLATVVRLPLDGKGRPCLATLERLLVEYAERPQRFVTLSAASNVTGVITDLGAAARLVHRHGGRLFVDFAAAGPYIPIDMTGTGDGDHLDAIFLSPHKFVGGPGASGLLVVDRNLHSGRGPTLPGGGTVRFVTPTTHCYLSDIEHIEEAGTPDILGDIRAGLVLQIKADIGTEAIHAAERRAVDLVRTRWQTEPGVELLGPLENRLAIFSFNLRNGNRLLHHGFVVRLLNDLFGIQARGGCSCAGPYGHELLGIGESLSARYQALIESGYELLKPGWVRLGLHYTMDEATVEAILEAVTYIARRGREFLPLYTPELSTGRWTPVAEPGPADEWAELCRALGRMPVAASGAPPDFETCRREADRIADEARTLTCTPPRLPAAAEELRWFWLPGEH